jgi:peptide/nickel transport system substrate-binding protein
MNRIDRRCFLATSAALERTGARSPSGVRPGRPRRGGTLRISVDQAVAKLNPLLIRVNPEYMVGELLYSSLTRLKLDMSAEPDLAASWASSPDLLEWTFVLRPA